MSKLAKVYYIFEAKLSILPLKLTSGYTIYIYICEYLGLYFTSSEGEAFMHVQREQVCSSSSGERRHGGRSKTTTVRMSMRLS